MSSTTNSVGIGARIAHAQLGECLTGFEMAIVELEQRASTAVSAHEEALQEAGRLRARVEELEKPDDDPVIYLLWSGRHDAWWRPDARGYTLSVDQAGRYTRAEALRHVHASAQCGIREQVTSMVAAPDNWQVSDRG